MSKTAGVDKTFLVPLLGLLVFGFATFLSASFGILAKDSAQFYSITFKQSFFGILLGLLACFALSRIRYAWFKKYAVLIFAATFLLTLAVFIPHLGIRLNGARRWISLFGLSLQPTAFLNFGFILWWASWLADVKDRAAELRYGLLPLIVGLIPVGIALLLEPDTDSFFILAATGMCMLLISGGKIRHLLVLLCAGLLGLGILALARPYVMTRITTFMHPAEDAQGAGWQVQQSSIAIGSGGMFGQGFGQSIQKYGFLPESESDSIFAVLGAELGFIGCAVVLGLFLFFIFRGLRIAVLAPEAFGGLLASGIVILIAVQSFTNIASILGIIPFSGIPLAFFSQGGTNMLVMLAETGIVLNISRFGRQKR